MRSDGVLRGWGGVIATFIVAAAMIVGGVWLSNNTPPSRHERLSELVAQCVADGGTPQYTFNDSGFVTNYYGCVKP